MASSTIRIVGKPRAESSILAGVADLPQSACKPQLFACRFLHTVTDNRLTPALRQPSAVGMSHRMQ